MKVICLKYPRNTVTDILLSLLCIFIILLILLNGKTSYIYTSSGENDLLSFVEYYGWSVDASTYTQKQIVIPIAHDKAYEDYFKLQHRQGFFLENYKGKEISVNTFNLLNYPGYEGREDIFINILTLDNTIIGADICCVSINGFITGVVTDGKNSS